jgi:hypothetical protein
VTEQQQPSEDNPYAPPATSTEQRDESVSREGPRGIGGWLLLPIIGLVLTPITAAVTVDEIYLPYILDEAMWEDEAYLLYDTIVVAEMLAIVAIGLAALVALVLLFRRSRFFPRLMIGYYLFNALVMVGSRVASQAYGVWSETEVIDRDSLRAIIAVVVWVPYFVMSKRVKNTFTR